MNVIRLIEHGVITLPKGKGLELKFDAEGKLVKTNAKGVPDTLEALEKLAEEAEAKHLADNAEWIEKANAERLKFSELLEVSEFNTIEGVLADYLKSL